MTFNSEEEKKALRECLINTPDLNETLSCLEKILKNRTPFGLYVATADRSDCLWIFEEEQIYDMIGGKDKYDAIKTNIFESEEEKNLGVVFFILNKIGPIYSVKVSIETINEIIDDFFERV